MTLQRYDAYELRILDTHSSRGNCLKHIKRQKIIGMNMYAWMKKECVLFQPTVFFTAQKLCITNLTSYYTNTRWSVMPPWLSSSESWVLCDFWLDSSPCISRHCVDSDTYTHNIISLFPLIFSVMTNLWNYFPFFTVERSFLPFLFVSSCFMNVIVMKWKQKMNEK